MTTFTLTSELEAINVMLSAADEAPVQSLLVPGLLPLTVARAVLDETSRLVQSAGWKFNTEYCYPLTRDTSGLIYIPGNVAKVDVDDDCLSSIDPVQRGSQLYDAKNHTFTFTRDVTATVVFLLGWSTLPQPARHYIMIKAARTFQARMLGSESVDKFTANDEQQALLAFSQQESDEADANMLSDSYSVASILYGRDSWSY